MGRALNLTSSSRQFRVSELAPGPAAMEVLDGSVLIGAHLHGARVIGRWVEHRERVDGVVPTRSSFMR